MFRLRDSTVVDGWWLIVNWLIVDSAPPLVVMSQRQPGTNPSQPHPPCPALLKTLLLLRFSNPKYPASNLGIDYSWSCWLLVFSWLIGCYLLVNWLLPCWLIGCYLVGGCGSVWNSWCHLFGAPAPAVSLSMWMWSGNCEAALQLLLLHSAWLSCCWSSCSPLCCRL